ncbi:cytochrome P450 [Nocardia sp. NBC_01329]|uniref:cytochrome P450 n=1 Tax=Nocardia sp. NBC_01329 TaxID=2903594 RepID=UPI002E1105A7|nr:cytochrome P450 [Nocardia sp. NBC_01329]
MSLEKARLFSDVLRGDPGARILWARPGADRHRQYEKVRARGALATSRRGLLFTASHALSHQVLTSSDFGPAPIGASARRRNATGDTTLVHPVDDSFLKLEPPRHTELRSLVAPTFHRRELADLGPRIEKIVEHRLNELPRGQVTDLITNYAEAVPMAMISHILGLPDTEAPRFAAWGNVLASLLDGARTAQERQRSRALVTEMTAYFRDRLNHVDQEKTGLIAGLARQCPARSTPREAIATCGMLLVGGFGTTTHLLGNTLHTLLRRPHLRPADGDYTAVIEESLRYDTPVQYVVRVAKTDTRLAGRAITAGTPIVLLLAAANRDPEIFTEPHLFDPRRREPHRHLTFGAGIHFCIGAALARAEAAIAVQRFFERYPDAHIAGKPDLLHSRALHGLRRLPVVLGT